MSQMHLFMAGYSTGEARGLDHVLPVVPYSSNNAWAILSSFAPSGTPEFKNDCLTTASHQ